jgi:hypothetical protein
MRKFALLGILLAVSHTGASATTLDGFYISNKNNQMRISGSRYVYIPRVGTTNSKNVRSSGSIRSLGNSQYQFSSFLSYICIRQGASLNCANGRRIWTRH